MLAREQRAAGQSVQRRVGITPGDKNALARLAVLVPFDRDPMRRVLAANACKLRNVLWPDMFEPDQANAGYGFSMLQLWPERIWQKCLDPVRVSPKVYQYAAFDYSLKCRKSHLL
jgi:hypothetical protein